MQVNVARVLHCWLCLSENEKKELNEVLMPHIPNYHNRPEILSMVENRVKDQFVEAIDTGRKKKVCLWCGK